MQRYALAASVAVAAVVAFLSPTLVGVGQPGLVGLLLTFAGIAEIWHGFRRSTIAGQRAAWLGGAITIVMGQLVSDAAAVAATTIVVLLAGWFALDAVRYVIGGVRGEYGRARDWLLPAFGNLAVVALVLLVRRYTLHWTLALAGGLRLAGTAWNLASSPVFASEDVGATTLAQLDLSDLPELAPIVDRLAAQEAAREGTDRGWIGVLLVTLFGIHLGRMGFDRSRLGIASPVFAVLGDIVLALVIVYAVILPLLMLFRKATRGAERRGWRWCFSPPDGRVGVWSRAVLRWALEARLRVSLRLRRARYSAPAAFSHGLQLGLPIAAVIAAIIPVFGMSWFFDSENWAAGMWNSWAEARTNDWREAMVRATFSAEHLKDQSTWYAVTPDGVNGPGDFAFLVIGDPGEGDASQHVLRDQVLTAAARPDVKFIAISSDVIYPTGAMRDYEAKFWLPMKGSTKPVYAIPGNHDWYDALEAFNATFLQPDAARIAMRARIEADKKLSTSTDAYIEQLIGKAAFYRAQYGVPTGFQRAPFFDVQTPDFVFVGVDTGIVRDVDPIQWRWLETELEAAKGKFVMAMLGHPLYAGGRYSAEGDGPFMQIHELLKKHGVPIVMAGDTHDFEYYAEELTGPDGPRVMNHIVNGGGGAYLSFGTALAWPAKPATTRWGFYPRTQQVRAKITDNMTISKLPLWWWTDMLRAWPFSVEWMSAAFDFNVAPFYQSFVEVRVERSTGRVRILPYGVNGRLRWSDLQHSADLVPAGTAATDFAEWTVPLK